jgi:hypothetical protein
MRRVLHVAWYRFTTTFRRRWPGYLSVVLLIGLMGGLAMGSVAAARRTQSSFPTFLASTDPSTMSVITGPVPLPVIARLPHVKQVKSAEVIVAAPLGANGAPQLNTSGQAYVLGSENGMFFNQDRASVLQGRMADPQSADQAVVTQEAAQLLGLRVGETVHVGFYTAAQTSSPRFGTAAVRPEVQTNLEIVGTVVLNTAVVQDDASRSVSALVLLTPALTSRVARCCSEGLDQFGVQVDRAANVGTVETEIERLLPAGSGFYVTVNSVNEREAEQAIEPESVALGVFGGIAALAALLIAGQLIARQLRFGGPERATLRALGADPAMTMSDGLLGMLAAVVVGSLLAVCVAFVLSPIGPIGPVRPVYPSAGLAFDWTVLGLGALVLAVVLSCAAAVLAYQQAPQRTAQSDEKPRWGSGLDSAGAALGLPISGIIGAKFALEPGRRRDAAPVRSAILGAALAVIIVTGTVTFGASLNKLISHPALYGWNWGYELESPEGGGYISQKQAAQLLDHDRDVAAWTGVYFDSLRVDGMTIPIIGGTPGAAVGPPTLTGHTLEANNQIVLGAGTLAELHKRVGDTVKASYGTISKQTALRIVGTATMPAVGPGLGLHLAMGTGALVSAVLIPAAVRRPTTGPAGPNAIFVRLRGGISRAAAVRSLQRVDAGLDSDPNAYPISVLSAQRPADIVNYRSMGRTPALLGAALAVGAVVALGLTLIASVRRRRRDLALLKTLGLTSRQLASVVAWQSSIAVLIGTVIGLPFGAAFGRVLWDTFAHEIDAVPAPATPGISIVLIGLGALVLANVVAAVPGRIASRTPTALVLRAE